MRRGFSVFVITLRGRDLLRLEEGCFLLLFQEAELLAKHGKKNPNVVFS